MAKDKEGSPEAGLVLGKAVGTLLTGASLSRKTEAADGLALGCLAQADRMPRLQSHWQRRGTLRVPDRGRTSQRGVLGHLNAFGAERSWTGVESRGPAGMEGLPELDL